MAQLNYEEVYLKAYANGLKGGASASASGAAFITTSAAPGLGLQDPGGGVGGRGEPVDLPLRLDDADASPTTPQGQQQQTVVHI